MSSRIKTRNVEQGLALFDTAIGRCGIAWSEQGISCVQLPEARAAETRSRLAQRVPGAREAEPPREVRRAIEAVVRLLEGKPVDLSNIALDMRGLPPFHQRVYEVARTIPAGSTLSYGEVAARLGAPGSARAVGQALGRNPFAIVVPCHRVLAAGGKLGGFSANGGTGTKLRMLAIEGAKPGAQGSLFDGGAVFGFDPAVALETLRASDPALEPLIERVGPFNMRLQSTPSLFRALSESIVYQQLSGKAAATIYGRVCALFPGSRGGPTPEGFLRIPDDRLRGAGLSRAKLLALKDLARKCADGELPTLREVHRMDDEAVVQRLTTVRGVGRWTVQMLLMFRLGRPDVLPVDDYGIRKGFALAFRKRALPTPKDLEKYGTRWKPYRTVASWYLWRALD